VVDVVAVPDRLEQPVREAERQHVLDRLLAQVVVDAEDLRLATPRARAVELLRGRQVVPIGFSMTTRTSAPSRGAARARRALDDRPGRTTARRQVEARFSGVPAARRTRRTASQALVRLGSSNEPDDVADVPEQLREHALVGLAPRELADRLLGLLAELLVAHRRALNADEVKRSGSAPSWARL
jgi:hypothetical protein